VGTVVFADTSFWLALLIQRDEHHRRALAWSRLLLTRKATTLTTEVVLWEWLNACCGPTTRKAAAEGYWSCHDDPQVEIIPFHSDQTRAAVKLYESRSDKSWSLTDCFSFLVMQNRQVTEALTTDAHFRQAGHRALLLEEPPAE